MDIQAEYKIFRLNNSPVTRFVFLSKTGNFFYAPLKNGALFLSLVKVRLVPVAKSAVALSDRRTLPSVVQVGEIAFAALSAEIDPPVALSMVTFALTEFAKNKEQKNSSSNVVLLLLSLPCFVWVSVAFIGCGVEKRPGDVCGVCGFLDTGRFPKQSNGHV